MVHKWMFDALTDFITTHDDRSRIAQATVERNARIQKFHPFV